MSICNFAKRCQAHMKIKNICYDRYLGGGRSDIKTSIGNIERWLVVVYKDWKKATMNYGNS